MMMQTPLQPATSWSIALSDYLAKRSYSDSLPLDHADGDVAVDAYCEAMDHLVEEVRAPNADAVAFKIELAKERWDGFGVPEEWLDAFVADVRHLTDSANLATQKAEA